MGTAIVVKFCADDIYFVTQIMGDSSLNITASIEFDPIVVATLKFVVSLSALLPTNNQ